MPEDARFCHRCGAPQFEADQQFASASEPAVAPPPPTPTLEAHRITFKNSQAVVVSLLVAACSVIGLPLVSLFAAPLFPVFLCAVGFAAARIYRARSAETLSTAAGARLGWMTGLWLFLVVTVMLALLALFVASAEGWRQMQTNWANFPQTAKLHLTQHEFLIQMLWTLPFAFFLLTLLPGLGGILGAKLFARRPR